MNLYTALFSIYAFFLPFSKDIYSTAHGIILVLFLISAIKNRGHLQRIWEQPVVRGLSVFYGLLLITVPFSPVPMESLEVWVRRFAQVTPLLVLAALKLIDQEKKKINIPVVFGALFASGTLISLYEIYQYLLSGRLRVTHFFSYINGAAAYFEMIIPFLLTVFFVKKHFGKEKIFCGLSLVLHLVALILTQTRGIWLGIAVAFILILGLALKHQLSSKKNVTIILVILFIFSGISAPLYLDRVETIVPAGYHASDGRFYIWESSSNMIKDHPITGIGLGMYQELFETRYVIPEAIERSHVHAHNEYLMALVEGGIFGIAGFSFLIYSIFRYLRNLMQNPVLRGQWQVLGMAGLFSSVLISSFFDCYFLFNPANRSFWLILGLVIYAENISCLKGAKSHIQQARNE